MFHALCECSKLCVNWSVISTERLMGSIYNLFCCFAFIYISAYLGMFTAAGVFRCDSFACMCCTWVWLVYYKAWWQHTVTINFFRSCSCLALVAYRTPWVLRCGFFVSLYIHTLLRAVCHCWALATYLALSSVVNSCCTWCASFIMLPTSGASAVYYLVCLYALPTIQIEVFSVWQSIDSIYWFAGILLPLSSNFQV